jgi:hypothetical protein
MRVSRKFFISTELLFVVCTDERTVLSSGLYVLAGTVTPRVSRTSIILNSTLCLDPDKGERDD